MTRTTTATVFTVMVLIGCGHDADRQQAVVASADDVARAAAASEALKSELAGRLFTELERSGPLTAIDVCSRVAQEIALDHSRDGLAIRRVSLKVRNPANNPDAWEKEQLHEFDRILAAGRVPDPQVAVVQSDDGYVLRYLEPLRIAPPCLACHGDPADMSAELSERLADLYPDDRAIGYDVGEVRGAVSVRMTLDEDRSAGAGAHDG